MCFIFAGAMEFLEEWNCCGTATLKKLQKIMIFKGIENNFLHKHVDVILSQAPSGFCFVFLSVLHILHIALALKNHFVLLACSSFSELEIFF